MRSLHTWWSRRWLAYGCLPFLFLVHSCFREKPRPRPLNLPLIVLWAWERPEDLSFLDSSRTGIAFLAAKAFIGRDGSTVVRMRSQPLVLPPGAALLPVVRIESLPRHAPVRIESLLSALETVAALPGSRGLQIDFDARQSEHAFYQLLLTSLRRQTAVPISITALVSWCDGTDKWLDDAPVDEAVPMFFRMGRGESRDSKLRLAACRSSIGLSTDELWPANRLTRTGRVYLFSPRPWTKELYRRALQRLRDWQ